MPYYDDEMTDRAVAAMLRWQRQIGAIEIQPNPYMTYRSGDLIYIGNTRDEPVPCYRVIRKANGQEAVRRILR